MMTGFWYFAALLLVLVSVAHSYLGERYILQRLFKRELPKLFGSDDFTKRTLRFAWHLTSVAWLGFAVILLILAEPNAKVEMIAQVIAITFLLHFAMALFGSRGKHLSWLVFLLTSLSIVSAILFS
ncbi:hypothetical protein ACFOEE_16315 [Pseudoalteromonas fenneropenaei]|uniref:DUF3325 domain-containing protein n=1 Tax=Pseudoalteromonas fenneropenaei TaxID=1737459 RepID=A0ABV7CND0_9GAMM